MLLTSIISVHWFFALQVLDTVAHPQLTSKTASVDAQTVWKIDLEIGKATQANWEFPIAPKKLFHSGYGEGREANSFVKKIILILRNFHIQVILSVT